MARRKYQFQFSRNAEKDFASLDKVIRGKILKKLDYFEKSPDPFSFAKPLRDFAHRFRFRIGDYRLIVTSQNDGVLVILIILKIGHRREVYK